MLKLLLFAAGAGLLGALIGAIAVYVLAGGLPEGALMGAIIGGSAGILIAARLDARQAENAFARSDPDAAKRSAALLTRRDRQAHAFLHQAPSYINPLKKLQEFASDVEQSSEREAKDGGQ